MIKVLLAADADIEAKNKVSRILCIYVPQFMLAFVCLFVCFEFFDKRFFIFYILIFICSKRKEILSNFLFLFFVPFILDDG